MKEIFKKILFWVAIELNGKTQIISPLGLIDLVDENTELD